MLFSFANSTIAFAAIVDVATAPPHATITLILPDPEGLPRLPVIIQDVLSHQLPA